MGAKTILVVDDDKTLRDEVCSYLSRMEHSVISAESGERALKIIEDQAVHAVVCDIIMPDGNGYWLLERLNEQSIRPPVFCFHSANPEVKEEDVIDKGADAFFSKFHELEKLREWLKKKLNGSSI